MLRTWVWMVAPSSGRETKHLEDLFVVGARVVLVRHPDPEGAGGESLGQGGAERGVVFGQYGVVPGRRTHGLQFAQRPFGVVAGECEGPPDGAGPRGHRLGTDGHVRDGGAVVQDRPPATPRQVGRRERHPALQLQRGGDSVAGLELVGAVGLAVRVQVDEARGDHEAGDVEHYRAGEGAFGYRGDLPGADGDVAHGVEARFGVHDAPAREHDVVAALGEEGGGGGHREEDGREGGGRIALAYGADSSRGRRRRRWRPKRTRGSSRYRSADPVSL